MNYLLWTEAAISGSHFLFFLLWISIALYTAAPISGQDEQSAKSKGNVESSDASHSPVSAQTIDFFVQKALENNSTFKAGMHEAAGSKKMYESETMFMENPMFSVGLVNVPLSTFPSLEADTMTGIGFMLSQDFALPGESESRKQMARQEFYSREAEVENMRLMLINQTQTLFYELGFLYHKKKSYDRKPAGAG